MKGSMGIIDRIIAWSVKNPVPVMAVLVLMLGWGLLTAPFAWDFGGLQRDPVPVDAIPDIGENQQIIFSAWPGRSPKDVEDQISYPLTTALLGMKHVRSVRSISMFGLSSIYVIFDDRADFYESRTRILEKLNSLPPGTLPEGIAPSLGPDATSLGQVFWYTLEGLDEDGERLGGWDLHELRTIQDYYVRYALQSVPGVAEVSGIGGFQKEYQVEVDPQAMREQGVSLSDIYRAVKAGNLDTGARTVEINRVEYVVRGLGFIRSLEDLEFIVLKMRDHMPVYLKDVANITLGPGLRRGILDREGVEAVGGVAVVRYGENPMEVIEGLKAKIADIQAGLPSRTLEDGRVSQVNIVPFYDRSGLIHETLGTLNHALRDEILITVIVVLLMVMNLRVSILVSTLLPVTVLMVFIAMKLLKVDANIVALSGIAIAIGTIVDMGIVLTENMLRHLEESQAGDSRIELLFRAASEVGSAILTAVLTTVISFLPVFTMEAAEGKLFKPLAYTKTFALIASILLTLTVLPALAALLMGRESKGRQSFLFFRIGKKTLRYTVNFAAVGLMLWLLASRWAPLGYDRSVMANLIFTSALIAVIMGGLMGFTRVYPRLLRWGLEHKGLVLSLPGLLLLTGMTVWLGADKMGALLPDGLKSGRPFQSLVHLFPGMGREFMPPLDEGSFLYMPTTMPHAGVEESAEVLRFIDMALASVPEVETAVGKAGRADSALDPAPLSMIETVVNYSSEYIVDAQGRRIRFAVDGEGQFLRDEAGELIPDRKGQPFRQWRDHIRTANDIWDELVKAADIPGTTSAPMLQPISARIVMLQSGMRAPMGIKVYGQDLETIEKVSLQIEDLIRSLPAVKSSAVFADRPVGKPYLEIRVDRSALGSYGASMQYVQELMQTAIGGREVSTVFEDRERYALTVRYMRDFRDSMEALESLLISMPDGTPVPLGQLAEIEYVKGPQMIRSEDGFLVNYVLFDRKDSFAELEAVEQVRDHLQRLLDNGDWSLPPSVSYRFAGSWENQVRAMNRLRIILPLALLLIFLLIYMQFRRISVTFIIFSGILVAWSGAFVMLWLYAQPWFMNVELWDVNLQTLFQISPVNLSVAVWVGFLALFGIATDDGVLISTYIRQSLDRKRPESIEEVREAVVQAGSRRIRPAMMTSATTILALLPVLSSVGRGSDIMVPMAIPSFGGMVFAILTTFVVPLLYASVEEYALKRKIIEMKKLEESMNK